MVPFLQSNSPTFLSHSLLCYEQNKFPFPIIKIPISIQEKSLFPQIKIPFLLQQTTTRTIDGNNNIQKQYEQQQEKQQQQHYNKEHIQISEVIGQDQLDLLLLERIGSSLDCYSELELLLSKKFDTSSFIDRSDLQLFPDVYIAGLLLLLLLIILFILLYISCFSSSLFIVLVKL